MDRARLSFLVFPFVGLVSGVCSGFSVTFPPLGLVAPGLLFGAAIAFSIHVSVTNLSLKQRYAVIGMSTVSYFLAIAAMLLCIRIAGFGNGIFYGAFCGVVCGGIGAFMIAISLAVVTEAITPPLGIVFVAFTGAILGGVSGYFGIYISDYTSYGHPLDDFVSYTLWQVGVAAAIPFCGGVSCTRLVLWSD